VKFLGRETENEEKVGGIVSHLHPLSLPSLILGESLASLNSTSEFSPYLKENTTRHHYSNQLVDAV
jgi:hypothetical protein